jgi:hypothetical protein
VADRDRQAREAYLAHRLEDQRGWYEERVDEFRRAGTQLAVAVAVLLFAGTVLSALAGLDWAPNTALAAAGAAVPAIATAVGAYASLQAYDRLAKSYDDTAAALEALALDPPGDPVTPAEDVMRVEQGQWGQLVAEIPDAQPPIGR